MTELILRAARGENLLKMPRAPAPLDSGRAGLVDKVLQNEREFEAKLDAWLVRRRQQ